MSLLRHTGKNKSVSEATKINLIPVWVFEEGVVLFCQFKFAIRSRKETMIQKSASNITLSFIPFLQWSDFAATSHGKLLNSCPSKEVLQKEG